MACLVGADDPAKPEKLAGVAIEPIYPNDIVFYEGGLVRRLRQDDGPLDQIKLPTSIRDMKIVIEKVQK